MQPSQNPNFHEIAEYLRGELLAALDDVEDLTTVSEFLGLPALRGVGFTDLVARTLDILNWIMGRFGRPGVQVVAQFLAFVATSHEDGHPQALSIQYADASTGKLIDPDDAAPASVLAARYMKGMAERDSGALTEAWKMLSTQDSETVIAVISALFAAALNSPTLRRSKDQH